MISYQNGFNEVQKVTATLELEKAFTGTGLPFPARGWCGMGGFRTCLPRCQGQTGFETTWPVVGNYPPTMLGAELVKGLRQAWAETWRC